MSTLLFTSFTKAAAFVRIKKKKRVRGETSYLKRTHPIGKLLRRCYKEAEERTDIRKHGDGGTATGKALEDANPFLAAQYLTSFKHLQADHPVISPVSSHPPQYLLFHLTRLLF